MQTDTKPWLWKDFWCTQGEENKGTTWMHPMHLCSSAAVGRALLPPVNAALTASETLDSTEPRYRFWQQEAASNSDSSCFASTPGITPFT